MNHASRRTTAEARTARAADATERRAFAIAEVATMPAAGVRLDAVTYPEIGLAPIADPTPDPDRGASSWPS